jgi:hypothetical protein
MKEIDMQIGRGKQGVLIGEYRGPRAQDTTPQVENPPGSTNIATDQNAVIGYIEPACDNPQWILWFTQQGDAIFHQKRAETGAVLDKALVAKGQAKEKNKKTIKFTHEAYSLSAGKFPKRKI